MSRSVLGLALFSALVAVRASRGDILRVPAEHPTIQAAIQASGDGDEVLVAAGEYAMQETLSFQGKTITLRSEAGAEATVLRRAAPPAIGESISVVGLTQGEGKNRPASIEGFTVTGGAPASAGEGYGGGILCQGAALDVRDCVIIGNEAGYGGGIAIRSGGSVVLERTRIARNSVRSNGSSGRGAAVYCEDAAVSLKDCQISGNTGSVTAADGGSGAVDIQGGSASLTDCLISENIGSPGVHAGRSQAIFERCRIVDNFGGGVSAVSSPVELRSCDVSGNLWGFLCTNGTALLSDSTLARNVEVGITAGQASSPRIDHCTIAGNAGPALEIDDSAMPIIRSSILWENVGGSIRASSIGGASAAFSFSCVEGEDLVPGEENINVDPLFCGWGKGAAVRVNQDAPPGGDGSEANPFESLAEALDFHLALSSGSPCFGTADGGTNRGADHGTCADAGEPARLVILAAGGYSFEGRNLVHHAGIFAEGIDRCAVQGPMLGLRSGSTVFGLTVTGGEHGIIVGPREAPHIEMVAVTGAGGGILCLPGSRPEIDRCFMRENVHGLICHDASPIVRASGFSSNLGTGISCAGESSPTVSDCDIGNNADKGIRIDGGSATFERCRIVGNRRSDLGAGISVGGGSTPSFTACEISRNRGPAVYCGEQAVPTLSRCRISGNNSVNDGAVRCEGASPWLINCLVEANRGGGVVARGVESEPVLIHCTVTGNEIGGVICRDGALPTVTNGIVWGNSPDGVCGAIGTSLTDRDPLFVRRAVIDFNRSFEEGFVIEDGDYRLQEGSPAIDVGEPLGVPADDLDGSGRPCGGGMDLGAYETGRCSPANVPFVRGDTNGDGSMDLSDSVAILGYLFLGGEQPGCLRSADLDDSGDLDLSDPVYLLNYLFLGGPEPALPVESCGSDPTVDDLGCEFYAPCEPT